MSGYSNNYSSMGNANAGKMNDPYLKRDAYAQGQDPYATTDPYENKNRNDDAKEQSKPFAFWFNLKEQIQDVFSSDLAFAEENRVLPIDKDMFSILLVGRIIGRGITNMFVIPLILTISFLIGLKATPGIMTIIVFINAFFMLWFLFIPAHQTISAGAYAIGENSIEFYKKWRMAFNSYQLKTVMTYPVTFAALVYFAYNPDPIRWLLDKVNLTYEQGAAFEAILFLSIGNTILIVLYVFFVAKLKRDAAEERERLYQKNIKDRMVSEVERKQNHLDEGL